MIIHEDFTITMRESSILLNGYPVYSVTNETRVWTFKGETGYFDACRKYNDLTLALVYV